MLNSEEAAAGKSARTPSRRRVLQVAAGGLGASLAFPGVFYKMADAIAQAPARAGDYYRDRTGPGAIPVAGHPGDQCRRRWPAHQAWRRGSPCAAASRSCRHGEAECVAEPESATRGPGAPEPRAVRSRVTVPADPRGSRHHDRLGTSVLSPLRAEAGQGIGLLQGRYPLPGLSAGRPADDQVEGPHRSCHPRRADLPQ